MARLIWTEPALIDLDEIAEYIALDNPSAAKMLVQKIFQKLERLEHHPPCLGARLLLLPEHLQPAQCAGTESAWP